MKTRAKNSGDQSVLRFANQLMRPLKKYGDKGHGYNFSRAKTAKQKAEIVQIWIGEIIYEAIKYRDTESLKSLVEMVVLETEGLVSPKKNK